MKANNPYRHRRFPGQAIRPQGRLPLVLALGCGMCSVVAAQNSSLMHAPVGGSGTAAQVRRSANPANGSPPFSLQSPRTAQRSRQNAGGNGSSVAYPGQAAYPNQYANQGAGNRPAVTLDMASWTYQPPPPLRVFQKNDVVTIRVDEITRVLAEGAAESRKRTLYEAILTDWIRLTDWRLRPDPQANGDPAVATESNANYRAESTVESRESMAFNIAATVVDIRSNGTLVLEARKAIRVNDNLWETSLSGTCRAQDIGPDNVVLSKDLIDLEIRKQDQGHLRDGYKRGWFQRLFDRVQPF